MTTRDHERYEQDVGAYLLGALTELEQQAFEQHLAGCDTCQQDVHRLRGATESLPRSVEQYEAPPALKEQIMASVRAEAHGPAEAERSRRPRFRAALPRLRQPAWMAVAAVLAVVLVAAGFYQLGKEADDPDRTIAAQVDESRVPDAGGRLVIPDEDGEAAVLEVNGMPRMVGREVLHVWLQRDGQMVAASRFEVGPDGEGFAGIGHSLDDVDAVLVTREVRPVTAPTEDPVLTIPL